jgi:outer membrane protein, heavy metal efflux system
MKYISIIIFAVVTFCCCILLQQENLFAEQKQSKKKKLVEKVSSQSFLNTNQNLRDDLINVLESVYKNHPTITASLRDFDKAIEDNTAALGEYDLKLKAYTKGREGGYYQFRNGEVRIEQPLVFQGINTFLGYDLSDGRLPVYDQDLLTRDGGRITGGIQIPLLRGREIDDNRYKLLKTLINIRVLGAKVNETFLKITKITLKEYWNYIAAKAKVKIFSELENAARTRNDQISERVKYGDEPRIDLVDNTRLVLKRQSQRIKEEQNLKVAEVNLQNLLQGDAMFYHIKETSSGSELVRPNRVNTDDTLYLEGLYDIAVKLRPELSILRDKRIDRENELKLLQNNILPNLDFETQFLRYVGDGDKELANDEVKVGLKFEVPLQRRKARGGLAGVQAEIARFNADIQNQELIIRNELQESLAVIQNTREQYTVASEEVKAAREVFDGEQEKFFSGDSNLLTLNLREQALAEASMSEISALGDYNKAKADLMVAVGEISLR